MLDDVFDEGDYLTPNDSVGGDDAVPNLPGGEEPGTPSPAAENAQKKGPKTMYDIPKVGRPGTLSSAMAMNEVKLAYREAAGYKPPSFADPLFFSAVQRRLRSLFSGANDLPSAPRFTPVKPRTRKRANGSEVNGLTPPVDDPPRAEPRATHADMPFAVVPLRWYKHIRVERGRGATRSRRTYFEAIHVLAYVTFMYAGEGRFEGHILHMNQSSICKMLGITSDDYLRAVRYLQREGYITRVVIRGFVPWDARARGSTRSRSPGWPS